jgi:hypothetical protein
MNKDDIFTAAKGLSLVELRELQEALRLEVKSRVEEGKIVQKEAKLAAKEAGMSLKDSATLGSTVSFTYKGKVMSGRVDKVTDKTVHVNAEEFGLDYVAGKQLYRYIKFENLVAVAVAEDSTEDEMAEAV